MNTFIKIMIILSQEYVKYFTKEFIVYKNINLYNKNMKRTLKGFSIAELLVVVSIIAILVAISIPIFSTQLEKARRAVDIANARNVVAVLKNGMNNSDIEFGNTKTTKGYETCIAIVVSKEGMKCYASGTTKIEGIDYDSGDISYQRVVDYLKKAGIDNYTLSSKSSKNDGWAFYVVILYNDGTFRIGSGEDDDSDQYGKTENFEYYTDYWKDANKSNIEKAMGL